MRFRDWFGQLDRGHRILVCAWGSVFLCMLLSPAILICHEIYSLKFSLLFLLPIFYASFSILLATQWLVFGFGSVLVRWLVCLITFYFSSLLFYGLFGNDLFLPAMPFSTIIIIWTILRGCKLLELKSLAEVERDSQQPWQFSIKYLLVIVTLLPLLIYIPSYFSFYAWRNIFGLAQFLIVTNLLVLGTHSRWWNIMLVPWAMTSWCWLNTKDWKEHFEDLHAVFNGTNMTSWDSIDGYSNALNQLTWLEQLADIYRPFLEPAYGTLIMSSMTAIYLGLLWCQRYAGYRLVLNRSQPATTIVSVAESADPLAE